MRFGISGTLVAIAVAGLFWAGDHYGTNARAYARVVAQLAETNAVLASLAKQDAKDASKETDDLAKAQAAFDAAHRSKCLIDAATANALNGFGGE